MPFASLLCPAFSRTLPLENLSIFSSSLSLSSRCNLYAHKCTSFILSNFSLDPIFPFIYCLYLLFSSHSKSHFHNELFTCCVHSLILTVLQPIWFLSHYTEIAFLNSAKDLHLAYSKVNFTSVSKVKYADESPGHLLKTQIQIQYI